MRMRIGAMLAVLGVMLVFLGLFRTGFYASPENRAAFNAQTQEELLTGHTTGQKLTIPLILLGIVLTPVGLLMGGRKSVRWLAGDRHIE